MALSTIRGILRATDVIVCGSAPLSAASKKLIKDPRYTLVCVNGSISSVDRSPDLWVLNSRNYDDPLYQKSDIWSEDRKQLHQTMMEQATNRKARHILFLIKNTSADDTINYLLAHNVKWRAHTSIHAGVRTDITRKAGVHRFTTAFNISAGLFGACLALAYNARSVTLCGFSFLDGYAYLPSVTNNRLHIAQDQEALPQLLEKNAGRFFILSEPS